MALRRCPGCMSLISEDVCPHCGYSAWQNNDSNQLPVGTMLRNQYQVGRVLGQGGFGITYIGWDTYLDMVVAIKEFYPTTAVNRDITQSHSVRVNTQDMAQHYEASRERFLREAKTLAKLRNIPEIVGIQSFFTENNTAYIIMEYVRGIDLRNYVQQKGGKLEAEETLRLLEPVVHALDTVHQEGLVHRDISPDNIMLLASGGAKLLDFGAARDVENADADVDLAHSTEAILKHGFAPMEQYRSRGNLGPWTDEYGFCASLYYCLTGKVPPDAPARAMDDAQPDWDSITGLTENQRAALEKGMAMRAKDRFGSMKELHQALYEQKPVPVQKPETEKAGVSKKKADSNTTKKKNKWIPLVACLLILVAAAGSAIWYIGADTCADMVMNGWSAFVQMLPEPLRTTLAVKQPAQAQPPAPSEDQPAAAETLPQETQSQLEDIPSTQPPAVVTVTTPEPWADNVLVSNPLSTLSGLTAEQVYNVTFYDTLDNIPYKAIDVSKAKDGSIMAWREWGDGCNIFFASDGGINARDCCREMFKGCVNLRTVSFGNAFHTDQATSMASMFYDCTNLTSADLEVLNTGNVTDMSNMFYGCNNLRRVNASNWDVSKVTNMANMFHRCSGLYNLDFGSWDVSNVTNMSYMFYYSSLSDPDFSNWDVSNVTNMSYMFSCCGSVRNLPVSDWDVSNVVSMDNMFSHCSRLQNLNLSKWDVARVTNMRGMLYGCQNLQTMSINDWDVSSVTDMSWMFRGCHNLQTVDVRSWDVTRVNDMSWMFYDCPALQPPDFSNWDVSGVSHYEQFIDAGKLIDGKFWKFLFEG